jgi:hypothetical protein
LFPIKQIKCNGRLFLMITTALCHLQISNLINSPELNLLFPRFRISTFHGNIIVSLVLVHPLTFVSNVVCCVYAFVYLDRVSNAYLFTKEKEKKKFALVIYFLFVFSFFSSFVFSFMKHFTRSRNVFLWLI